MKSRAHFTWEDLQSATSGTVVSHYRPFDSVTVETDSRALGEGCFFIPLKGPRFDGNTYIEEAYAKGATGAFVDAEYLKANKHLKRFPNLIAVPEPLVSYLELAQFHRSRSGVKVIAITGSSGKTTTKEMLYAMLHSVLGEKVLKSEKNYNNEVGVAMTLLNIQASTDVLILEMGMRGMGQIALLSHHAKPDVTVITNIGPAHIGLLGSLEAIAKAKCEIFHGMAPEKAMGIINGDDPLLVAEATKNWSGRLECFTLHDVEELHTQKDGGINFVYDGVKFVLGLPGSHNVMNALACLKVCEFFGVPLKKISGALADFHAGGGRWEKYALPDCENLWVINDAYNANPASVKVALTAFMDSPMPGLAKVAILGGMAELGEFSDSYHQEIGSWIADHGGLSALITIGTDAHKMADAAELHGGIPVYRIETPQEAVDLMATTWPRDSIFFLKASRAYGLETIPTMLQEAVLRHGVS